ncbi:hypothetical protein L524_1915 [Bordetella bronchiseptica MBORD762]|nr:hypothetical protein L524_1915 [Bordetella bronchiseptica MBORD762]
MPPGRPKAKKPPRGAASPHSGRSVGAFFCRRAAPRQKSPLGGQQARAAGAAWGPFFAAGPPQGKKAPSGGSKPAQRAQRGGLFLCSPHHRPQVPSPTGTDTVLAVNRSWRTAVCLSRRGQAPAAGAACGVAAMPALTRRSRPARAFP